MPSTSILSGVQDLPKILFAAGSSFRMTINMDADFPLAGKFAEFGIRCTTESATGSTRRIFRTDSDESNLSISSQIVSIVIDPADETVPAFTGGWTLADVQDFGDTEYWIDFSDDEGDAALLRLQGRAKWVKAGEDLEDGEAVISAPEFDVTITSGAVAVTVAVTGGEVGIPVGGSTGQVLKKTSATAYDVEWATVSGTGDVVGPASSTDNAITRFDGTSGKALQNSGITIADGASGTLAGSNSGDVTLAGSLDYITISGQTITRNAIDLEADVTGTLPAANGGTGQTSLGAVNAADLGSGAATDNYVLTADGLGGSAWEAPSGGGDALVANSLDQFADVTQTAGQTLAITSSTTLSGGTHSGTNTGDNAVNSLYSGLVTNATHTGDVTGATALTIADGVVTEAKCNSSINASLDLADSSIQPGNAALTDERVPTASGLTSKFGTNKATIVDADKIAILDSAATDAPKHSLFSVIKSTLKTYFDTLYAAALGADDNYVTDAEKTVIGNTSGTNTGDQDLSGLQPLDAQLTDLASLSYATNALKVVRVNAGETAFELAAPAGGGDALVANSLDQFADVTQTGGATLAISASTTLAGGSHSGTNTGDQDLSGYALTSHDHAGVYEPAKGADDNYVTDAEKTVIGNTSGTNTGDNAVNSLYSGLVTNATHTGDVTGDTALTIANDAVTFAKMQNISADHLIGRHSSGSGDPQQIGLSGGIELSGANLRRAELTGDVTAPAGDNALTIANGVVTEAKCNSSINASLDLADSSIQPGNAALTDERVPTAAGLTSKFGTNKATIVDGDKIAILDSAATDAPKHSLFSVIKSTLKTYFDTLYAAALGVDDNYVTDAEKTVIGNTSGTNTGDQDLSGYVLTTAIDTLAELNAIVADATLIDTNDARLSDARTPTAHSHEGTAILSTGETGGTKFLREDGDGTCSWQTIAGGGDALVGNPLSQFAATTSSQLAGVMSDETGTGALVFATSPTLVTPALGTPASGVLTNCTGLPEAGLADDAVTYAKMASGTAGNLITYDASGNPAAVETGTATHVLTSNGAGAAPTFQAAAGGGLTNFTETLLTAAPNATVNAVRLAVTGGTTNADLVLSPKGTGAIILGKAPDNTSVGGNKRGANAIDIQGFRDSAIQVASGASSIAIGNKCTASSGLIAIGDGATASGGGAIAIGNGNASGTYSICMGIGAGTPTGWQSSVVGGNSNAASGTNSGVFAGYTSTASAQSAIASGRGGVADRYNIHAHGTDGFGVGSAQAIRAVLSVKTTNATETELWLNGTNVRLTIPSGKILSAIVNVVGSKSDGTAVARYTRQVTIKNLAGTTSLVGSVETIGVDVADSTALAITANDTNDAIKIAVTGIAAETWRWVAVVHGTELIYGA